MTAGPLYLNLSLPPSLPPSIPLSPPPPPPPAAAAAVTGITLNSVTAAALSPGIGGKNVRRQWRGGPRGFEQKTTAATAESAAAVFMFCPFLPTSKNEIDRATTPQPPQLCYSSRRRTNIWPYRTLNKNKVLPLPRSLLTKPNPRATSVCRSVEH